MSYLYGHEARERISAFGLAKISEFIEEVPHTYRKNYYDRQPAISGFRRSSPLEFKEKQRRLIGHILHPQSGQKGDADWKTFANFWVAWARNQLGEDFPAGDRSAPQADAAPIFIETMVNKFPDAPREVLERLIAFSAFADHADTQAALGRFRPESTLARDRMIDGLPGRLDKIEGYLEIAETAAEEVAEHIELLESQLSSLLENVEYVSARIEGSVSEAADLRAEVEMAATFTQQLAEAVQALDDVGRKNTEALASTDERVKLIRQTLNAFSDQAQIWDEASAQLLELKGLVDQINLQAPDWTQTAKAVAILSEQIESLPTDLNNVGTGSGHSQQQVRLLEVEAQGPIVDIRTVENACELIACNLQASGIVKGAAISIARIVLTGLASGQIIQFSGSLADFVADAVAAAVGGPTFHEWRVPVGLMSEEAASDCFDEAAGTSGCLLLKGANRSAFEIYGTAIRDVVTRRQLSVAPHYNLALISSWAQGPAAFPDGGTLAELGPVINTDSLQMRGVSSRLPSLKYGCLKSKSWDQLEGFSDETSGSLIPDLQELLDESSFNPGNLWTRSAYRAYLQLRSTPGGSEGGDLHSMLMFWACPWAKASGGPFENITAAAERILAQQQAESSHLEDA